MSSVLRATEPQRTTFRMPPNRTKVVRTTVPALKVNALTEAVPESAIPSSFDARTKWAGLIGPVLNQEQCGSCYIFASTEVLMDRLMIALHKPVFGRVSLSQEYVLDCYTESGQRPGCQGGIIQDVMQWISAHPVPQGAPAYSGAQHSCDDKQVPIPKWYGNGPYAVTQGGDADTQRADIQREIMVNGPIAAGIVVYDDFQQWWTSSDATSGVYKATNTSSGNVDGGHAVKVIGWGTQNNEPYWLIQNSWGTTGGINGSGVYRLYDSTSASGSGFYSGLVAMHVDSSSANEQAQANAGNIPYPEPWQDSTVLYWVLGAIVVLAVLLVAYHVWG